MGGISPGTRGAEDGRGERASGERGGCRCFWLAVVFLGLLLPVWASAEQISPSARVQSVLNVRQAPAVESPVVGTLRPAETAELIEAVPYWYRVRLADGVIGYVSRGWAERVSEARQAGGLIRIGSWNVKKLGHGSSKDYAAVARAIEDHFDVIGLIEVMQKDGKRPGYEALLAALGSRWTGLVTASPRPRTGSGNAEFYAVLYRPAVVRPCVGWEKLVFFADNDGSGSQTGPDRFSREPAFGCFEAPANATMIGFDFLLATYHACWEKGDVAKIRAEVRHLPEVFAAMGAARPQEKDLLIVGDFNLSAERVGEASGFVVMPAGTGSTLNSQGGRTRNLYDHLVILDRGATAEMIGNPQILNLVGDHVDGKTFYKTISDHLPINASFRTYGPDDD